MKMKNMYVGTIVLNIAKIFIWLSIFFCANTSAQDSALDGFETNGSNKSSPRWLLYEIHQSGKLRGYIFGGSHTPVGNVLISTKVKESLEKSSALVFESNYFDENLQQEANRALMSNPDGRSLKDILSPDIYARLQVLIAEKNVPEINRPILNMWSPYMAAMALDIECGQVQPQGPSPELTLHNFATKKGIKILGMEGVEDQLGWLHKLSSQQWNDYLAAYFDWINDKTCITKIAKTNEKIWSATINGDVNSIHEEYIRFYSQDIKILWFQEQYFMTARNAPLSEMMIQMLGKESKPFFSIGTLHLGGEKGILNLLKLRGYKIVQR
jgi:uncharacterized protein YbaP (TraB family)